ALCTIEVEAQPDNHVQSIEVTFNKTSSLVFPTVIKSVDRGSRDVLAQKAKGVENVLQLKAARPGFTETNLTVITADGRIHHFTVNYSKEPVAQVVNIVDDDSADDDLQKLIFQSMMTESELEKYATQIVNAKRSIRFRGVSKHKIGLSLNGIYIRDNIIFYHFRISNSSNINYDIDFLRFFVQDKAKVKRTASQEVDMKPVYVYGDDQQIVANTVQDIVYALEKFTIPDAKLLHIEMFEKNGGRNLELSIRNKTIVNAKLIK
ncbi:MAG: conjugative transposon protein TraN, partial [Cyclobacteriaceae bacterium]|nr:conjugative transposon protein TraN [Cyclobacteriaceae bacterium]